MQKRGSTVTLEVTVSASEVIKISFYFPRQYAVKTSHADTVQSVFIVKLPQVFNIHSVSVTSDVCIGVYRSEKSTLHISAGLIFSRCPFNNFLSLDTTLTGGCRALRDMPPEGPISAEITLRSTLSSFAVV